MRSADRVATVDGGGYGVGRASSEALARESATAAIADLNDQAAPEAEAALQCLAVTRSGSSGYWAA